METPYSSLLIEASTQCLTTGIVQSNANWPLVSCTALLVYVNDSRLLRPGQFELSEEEKTKVAQAQAREQQRVEVETQIDEFESNLMRLGVQASSSNAASVPKVVSFIQRLHNAHTLTHSCA